MLHLRSLVARLRVANHEFHQTERKLDELCAVLSEDASTAEDSGPGDVAILQSLPRVGRSTLATLLTEAGGPLARREYAALRTLTGVAPVTKRRGKSSVVVMRHAAQARLRQAVFHWARVAVLLRDNLALPFVLPHPRMLPSRGPVASPECSRSTIASPDANTL